MKTMTCREPLLSKDLNDVFAFEKHELCDGILFDVYYDEYGMSYHLAWISPRTGEVKEWSCGMCNDYHIDMEDIALYETREEDENEDGR